MDLVLLSLYYGHKMKIMMSANFVRPNFIGGGQVMDVITVMHVAK